MTFHVIRSAVGKTQEASVKALGYRISIKVHYLDSHLGWFAGNLSLMSDEERGRFHQDMTSTV